MIPKQTGLRERILEEMTADRSAALESSFDLAKQFIRVRRDGRVDVLVKERVGGKEQILLYMIGKLYAKEAGFTPTDDVGNEELMEELGFPKGSVLPWLKELRDRNRIVRVRRGRHAYHLIPASLVEETLRMIDAKIRRGS